MSGLSAAATRLRLAVGEGRYEEAQQALEEYRSRFDGAWRVLAPGDPRGRALLCEARELLEWARRAATAGREHARAEYRRLSVAQGYTTRDAATSPALEIEG